MTELSRLGNVPDITFLELRSRCSSRELEEEAWHCVMRYEHALPFARIYANSATRRSTPDFIIAVGAVMMITERLRNLSQVRAMRAAFA